MCIRETTIVFVMISKDKFWNIKIDFQFITILITFFCYGLFGAISKNYNLIFSILTICILIFFYFYYKFNNHFFKFKFYYSDFFFLAFFFTIFFILNYNDLNTSLFGDEFADAKAAARTPIYSSLIFLNLIENEFFKNIPLKKIIYFLQFFQITFFFCITFLFYKKRNLITLLLIIFFILFFRLFLKEYGMHPPLQYIFNFLFTGFFGIHEFVIRLSYIFVYSLGCLVFFKQVCTRNNIFRSALISLFLFTIPIALLSSSSVNNSLWAFCFFSNFLIYLYFTKKTDYRFLILLVSIFALTRITIFFAIIPILILLSYNIILNFIKKEKNQIKKYIKFFVPTLLFLPFLIKTSLLGSIVHGETLNFYQIFNSLKYTFFNFILLKSILLNVPIYISVFILLIFFSSKDYLISKKIAVLLFFLSLVFIFSTISKEYIGTPRYNLEYFLPFCLLGFLIFLQNFNSIKTKNIILI